MDALINDESLALDNIARTRDLAELAHKQGVDSVEYASGMNCNCCRPMYGPMFVTILADDLERLLRRSL